ncbi:MAG: hypothetical protein Q9162_005363 [Coniocarpon cinnabarinum]
MNLPHSSPYHLGSGQSLEQLAPPRARSTSPLQKLWDWQYKGRTPQPSESHASHPNHERPVSYNDSVVRTEREMVPAPLRNTSRKSIPAKSRPTSSQRSSYDGGHLQSQVRSSSRSPKLKHKISRPLPLELQETRPGEYVLPATVYSQPPSETHHPRHHHQRSRESNRHSLNPPTIAEPQPSSRDRLIRYHTTRDIAASASAPTTPRNLPPQWPLPSPPQPPSRTADFRKSTFTTANDFNLFAEALSGLGPEPSSASMSGCLSAAPLLEPSTSASSATLISPLTPQDQIPSFSSHSLRALNTSSTFPPPNASSPPRCTPFIRSQSSFDIGSSPSIETPQTAIQRDLAMSGAMIGLNIEPNPGEIQQQSQSQHQLPDDDEAPADDELPDYEQSQREAADAARIKALNRAAELESRWAASAPHRRR